MDKDIKELLESIKRQNSSKIKFRVLLAVSIVIFMIIMSLMIPTAKALIAVKGINFIIPLIFLGLIWIYALYISFKKILQDRLIEAYGWLFGSSAIVIVFMLYYLNSLIKG